MIIFDKYGNPQPSGIVSISVDLFKKEFVDNFPTSTTRTDIYINYQIYVTDFKKTITEKFEQWLNGSYATKKENPNDIDLVNVVEYNEDLNSKEVELRMFLTKGGSKEKYLVDGYFIPIYPKDDPRYVITVQSIDYWLDFFGKDRNNREKSIFKVTFN